MAAVFKYDPLHFKDMDYGFPYTLIKSASERSRLCNLPSPPLSEAVHSSYYKAQLDIGFWQKTDQANIERGVTVLDGGVHGDLNPKVTASQSVKPN